MRATTSLCLLTGLALLTLGCGSDDDTASASDTSEPGQTDGGSSGDDDADASSGAGTGPLVGRTFLSESVTEDGQPRPLVDDTQITLTFDDDANITLNAGCNTLMASVEIEPDRLVVSGVGGTEMGCPDDLMDQDAWLAEVMEADPAYTLDGDRLRLESGATVIELVDREVADPDQPLEGVTWQLTGIVDGAGPDGTVSSLPAGTAATLLIEGGTVTVTNENCNGGRGPAEVDAEAGTVTFGPIITTRMGCLDPQAEVEAAWTAVLQGEVAYEIEAGSLTLTHPDGQGLTASAPE